MESEVQLIEAEKMPLEDWLSLLFNPPEGKLFINSYFPSDHHRKEYVSTIQQRPEAEVIQLLRCFLIMSGTHPLDKAKLACLREARTCDPEMFERAISLEFYKRLTLHYMAGRGYILPWEGNTWILDLLPHSPHQALQALDAYFLAHCQHFSDGQLHGCDDAQELIRAKFIGLPGTHCEMINLLLGLGPRTFECLIERLYRAMDYRTVLTPPQKDGGRDVVARRDVPGQQEHLLVECKLRTDAVGVRLPRELLGVVSDEKANKGVLITNSRFTKPAREFAKQNPRLELISGSHLVPLMNEYLGVRWPLQIERLVRDAEQGDD